MNLAKFLRIPFLQHTSGQLLLLLVFQKQSTEVFYEKCVLENFAKFTDEHLWFAKFSKAPFLQNTPGLLLLAFSCNVTKMWYCQQWKNSDEYSLPSKTNLRSTVQVYHFFLGSINFKCMLSLVYTVYWQKQPSE